MATDYCDVTSP